MNNLELITKNWKQLVIWALLLTGIAVLVYLVQTRQILRTRASSNINDGLKVTDGAGNELDYQNNTYRVDPDTDHVRVSIKNIRELISQ